MLTAIALCGFAFLAGLVDSVAGGGGLIQLPALLVLLPGAPIATLFGTNKVASIAGTAVALARYRKHVTVPWRAVLPAAIAAFLCAALGARAVSLLSPAALRPMILGLLILVAAYTLIHHDLGTRRHRPYAHATERWIAIAIGALLGFYDGFFGPGTGSFLIFAFVALLGLDFLGASAAAKAVNLGSNISAVAYFMATGQVFYRYALPMAACSVLGSVVGTHLAVKRGARFVRLLFLTVVAAILLRLTYDVLVPRAP